MRGLGFEWDWFVCEIRSIEWKNTMFSSCDVSLMAIGAKKDVYEGDVVLHSNGYLIRSCEQMPESGLP